MAGKKKNTVKKKPASKKKTGKKKVGLSKSEKVWILVSTWIIVLLPICFIYFMLWSVDEEELPSTTQLENPRSDEASSVYDAKGTLIGTYYLSNRTKVHYQDMSPFLVDALVATEDERFFDHSGVDGYALVRAVAGAGSRGGGSTITQQLAKMMFHERPDSKFGRIQQKFAEWIIARDLENKYTKKEIIAMYFNEFDFLHTAVGVHSAARVYFNKDCKDLKLHEAAVLVGMFKSPVIYNPINNPENALDRRNTVLGQMKKNGYLTTSQFDSITEIPIELDYHPETQNTGLAPYFRASVKAQAIEILKEVQGKNQFNENYNIYKDGLKIYTTLDANMQKHAEWAVKEHLSNELQAALDKEIKDNKNYPFSNEIPSSMTDVFLLGEIKKSDRYKKLYDLGWTEEKIMDNFNKKTSMYVFDWGSKNQRKKVEMTPMDSVKYHLKVLRVGLVSIDPKTGYIKAYVGGPDFGLFKYDFAAQSKRQVGSTIKPFVYAAGIESGQFTPCTEIPYIEYCIELEDGSQWCPKGSKFDGVMTPIYFGLATSSNPITAFLVKKNGGYNKRVVKYLKTMGLDNPTVEEVPSLGLGVCDQSVMDMTAAHAVFSNYGFYNKPVSILRIEDANGQTLYDSGINTIQVMSSEVAFDVLKMMKKAAGCQRPADGKWGGTALRLSSKDRPYRFTNIFAGKTGTTQSNTDGWFIGHTPDLVTGVWVGCEHRGVRFKTTKNGQGANTAMPIWGYYMGKVYKDKKIKISHGDFAPVNPGEPTNIECEVDTTDQFDFNFWD